MAVAWQGVDFENGDAEAARDLDMRVTIYIILGIVAFRTAKI
jgi:hypothetical protein